MGRAVWIPAQLQKFGIPYDLLPGWQSRGSAYFEPRGVVCHHTGGSGGIGDRRILLSGRSDLPPPLCNIDITADGRVGVIASGRANHAGRGGYRGLSGNSSVLGIEPHNRGNGVWTSAQRAVYPRACAALLDGIARDASWAPGHKNWTPRKSDPAGIDMGHFWREVDAILAGKPASAAAAAPLGSRVLRLGSSGPDVGALQKRIGAHPDEDFGPATERALIAWQRAHGLVPDGVAGPATFRLLLAAPAPPAPPAPPAVQEDDMPYLLMDPRKKPAPIYLGGVGPGLVHIREIPEVDALLKAGVRDLGTSVPGYAIDAALQAAPVPAAA